MEEVKKWKAFEYLTKIYDLSHLDAGEVCYKDDNKEKPTIYKFYVTYSCHCFTENDASLSEAKKEELIYSAPKEQRPFSFARYELSKKLPIIISNLPSLMIRFESTSKMHHQGRYGFLTITYENYVIFLSFFREQKKLRIHVRSAYKILNAQEKYKSHKKMKFFSLAHNLLGSKPIKEPHK